MQWAQVERGRTLTMRVFEPAGQDTPLFPAIRTHCRPGPSHRHARCRSLSPLPDLPMMQMRTRSASGSYRTQIEPRMRPDPPEFERAQRAFEVELATWEELRDTSIAHAVWSPSGHPNVVLCEVEDPPAKVRVQVRVVDIDGAPVAKASVGASASLTAQCVTDAEGRCAIELTEGFPTAVQAVLTEFSVDAPRDPVVLSGSVDLTPRPDAAVTVTLQDMDIDLSDDDFDEILDRSEQIVEQGSAPLRRALQDPTLSDEARARLRAWLAEEQRAVELIYGVQNLLEGIDD